MLPYIWLKSCIMPFFFCEHKWRIIKRANFFFSFLLLPFNFCLFYGLRKWSWSYHAAHKVFEDDQMCGIGFVRLKLSWNAGL